MKIIFLLCTREFSGAENISLMIAGALAQKGYDVSYCSPHGGIEKVIKNKYQNVKYIALKEFSIGEIKSMLKKEQPDLVHAVDFKVSFYCALLGINFISHLHNNPEWLKKISLNSIALYFAIYKAKHVITVSNSVLDEYVFNNIAKSKYTVLENIVNFEYINELSKESYEKKYDIAFIGRITEQKNPLKFIKIIEKISKTRNVSAVMIGADGGLYDECKGIIEQNKLPISMVGFIDNPYKIIKNVKFVIMPSRWEGFGLTAVESGMLGKPVLAAPVGGLKDIFKNNENGGHLCTQEVEYVHFAIKMLDNDDLYKDYVKKTSSLKKLYGNIDEYITRVEMIYKHS